MRVHPTSPTSSSPRAIRFFSRSLLTGTVATLLLGAGAEAQRPTPVVLGDGYKITAGPLEVALAPSRGARIRSVKFDGTEILIQDSAGSPGNLGSTFWVSPQAHWTATCRSGNNNGCWPPPTQHDGSSTLYTGGLVSADNAVSYTGAAHTVTGTRLRKTVWANTSDTSISIRYHIVNTLTTKIAYAPWEVTRLAAGGLTFWAKSPDDTIRGNGTSGAALIAMIKDTLGVKWHKYDSTVSLSGGTPKFWDATSEGWFARVDKSRLLYVKKFVVIPKSKKAPVNENQIEYYTNNNTRSLMEMELQGAFDSIAAGDSIAWDVKWYVRRLPDSIAVTPSAALLAFARATAADRPTSLRSLRSATSGALLATTANRVSVTLSVPTSVSLTITDAAGRVVERLHEGPLAAGAHEFHSTTQARGAYRLVLRNADGALLNTRAFTRL